MREYGELLEVLDDVPVEAADFGRGVFPPPSEMWSHDIYGGFPPAFVPLCGMGYQGMYGYWLPNWFDDKRQRSIVELYSGTTFGGYRLAMESACNFRQFAATLILVALTAEDERTPQIEKFAARVGIDVEVLDRIAGDAGDDLEALLSLPDFAKRPPQSCFQDPAQYPGTFPHYKMPLTSESLRHCCSYEVHSRFRNGKFDPENFRQHVASLPHAPTWLRTDEQPPVFLQLLRQGDLHGAWMSLNSIGWTYGEARQALRRLADKVGDKRFDLLTELWSLLPAGDNDRY
jgi:hypothetical protein